MKRLYEEDLKESNEMTVGEFCDSVEQSYYDYFPNSLCVAKIYKMLGMNISIDCLLAKDKSEVISGILMNDLFSVSFLIQDLPMNLTEDSIMPDILLEANQSSVTTKPDNKYMAYGRVKVPFRKTTGTPEKILKALDIYFGRLYSITKELYETDMIPEGHLDKLDIVRKL